jgi:hypothetical protein
MKYMAKNKIQDLRDHLFETIENLRDDDSKMTVERAKAIAEVSQVIINTAKLEFDLIKVLDKADGYFPSTGFVSLEKKSQPQIKQ